jgi:hypothetical protein
VAEEGIVSGRNKEQFSKGGAGTGLYYDRRYNRYCRSIQAHVGLLKDLYSIAFHVA